jgi:hypothetical protein
MKLPYVIDNQTHVLADILRGLLTDHDIPLTAIVTPTEVIESRTALSRPKEIYWKCCRGKRSTRFPRSNTDPIVKHGGPSLAVVS